MMMGLVAREILRSCCPTFVPLLASSRAQASAAVLSLGIHFKTGFFYHRSAWITRPIDKDASTLKSRDVAAAGVMKADAGAMKADAYLPVIQGEVNTKAFKVFISQNQRLISPWHDIPLFPRGKEEEEENKGVILHYVNEIPKDTSAKYEISKEITLNPIVQDTKNGKLRFIRHMDGVLYNYGAIPQTWEDPRILERDDKQNDHVMMLAGDNDPLDAVEISDVKMQVGEVGQVKLLGTLGLVDEGECDWKLITINVKDPRAEKLQDITDVPSEIVERIREWYRVYKVIDGKKPNRYLFGGEAKNQSFASDIVKKCHERWKILQKEGLATHKFQ